MTGYDIDQIAAGLPAPTLNNFNQWRWIDTRYEPGPRSEAFQCPHFRVRPLIDRGASTILEHRGRNRHTPALGAGRHHLDHGGIRIPVNDQAG